MHVLDIFTKVRAFNDARMDINNSLRRGDCEVALPEALCACSPSLPPEKHPVGNEVFHCQ